MHDQVIQRTGPPPHKDNVPLWGWYQWCRKGKRPDLRYLRHYWGPEGNHVMIECEIPDEDVLLSDHDSWNVILNNGYLGLDEKDDNLFYKMEKMGRKNNKKFGPFLDKKIKKSWDRIFELEALNDDYWGRFEEKSIQACFWRIDLDQVMSHKRFTSKYPKDRQPRLTE